MQVRIIGNGNRWRIVANDGRVCGFAGSYSQCLLIAGQRGWRVV